jgi:hypothetical protein
MPRNIQERVLTCHMQIELGNPKLLKVTPTIMGPTF